ncbi:MAG: hypothetical protein HEQ27_21875, partial [Dolichospermum sp. JUN01]|nr:hypothetical protein [Dolichospermum sp. JUN01]
MNEIHLKVYLDRSELVLSDGTIQTFPEGVMNQSAKERYLKIGTELSKGYLARQILTCKDISQNLDFSDLSQTNRESLDKLVQSVTSDFGRGLVGLAILQLCVKAIEPR